MGFGGYELNHFFTLFIYWDVFLKHLSKLSISRVTYSSAMFHANPTFLILFFFYILVLFFIPVRF